MPKDRNTYLNGEDVCHIFAKGLETVRRSVGGPRLAEATSGASSGNTMRPAARRVLRRDECAAGTRVAGLDSPMLLGGPFKTCCPRARRHLRCPNHYIASVGGGVAQDDQVALYRISVFPYLKSLATKNRLLYDSIK